jgi:hypothetical protein
MNFGRERELQAAIGNLWSAEYAGARVFSYLYISPAWVLSRTAQKIYAACAVLSLAFAGMLLVYAVVMLLHGPQTLHRAPVIATLTPAIILPAMPAIATLQIAMFYFWWGFQKGGAYSKAAWLIALLFPPYGTLIYYAFVYCRQMRRKTPQRVLARSAGA